MVKPVPSDSDPVSRRHFLGAVGMSLGSLALLAACGGTSGTTAASTPGSSQATTVSAATTSVASVTSSAALTTSAAPTSVATTSAASTASNSAAGSALSSTTSANAATSVTSSAAPAVTQSASVAKATATLMIAFQGSSQANFVQWDPIWAAWQQAHPEIKTQHDGFEGLGVAQYGEKLITLLAGGTSYDALHVHYTIAGEFMASKLVRPIDSLIAQDAAVVNMGDYAPGLLSAFQWQGKQYGLPIEANPWLLWYNSDLFKKYGVPAPTDLVQAKQWTWTGGFRQRAQAATHVDANPPVYGYGGWQQGTGSSGYAGWGAAVWANGGDLWTSDKSALALDQPPALEALQFWADLSNKDKVAPPQDQPKLWDHSSGTIGMGLFAPFTVPNFDKYHWQPGMVVNPSGPAGLFHNSGSSMYSIATTAKNPDPAWTWAKWISDDGIKVWLDKGFFTGPPRKSLANYTGWVKSRKPWESTDAWAQATATIRLPFGVPNWTPIMTALAGELDKAMKGQETVAEAIAKVKDPINSLLKQGLT